MDDSEKFTKSPLSLDKLYFLSWNINSIHVPENKSALSSLITNLCPAVIFLQETRHALDCNGYIRNFSTNFQIFDCPSQKRTSRSRGLITLVHKDILVSSSNYFSNDAADILYTVIKIADKSFTLINYYQHSTCQSHIFDYIQLPNNASYVISGDSNLKHSTWGANNPDMAQGSLLLNYINSNSVSLINNRDPTFSRGLSSIDLTFCSPDLLPDHDFEVISHFGNKSDHFPITFSFFIGTPQEDLFTPSFFGYNTKCANWPKFTDLTLEYFSNHPSNSEPTLDLFEEIISTAAANSIPVKTYKRRPHNSWFFDNDCILANRAYNRAKKEYRSNRTDENLRDYLEKRDIRFSVFNDAKRRSWQRKCRDFRVTDSTKPLWRILNSKSDKHKFSARDPDAAANSDKFMSEFSLRTSCINIPSNVSLALNNIKPHRKTIINNALSRSHTCDIPFTSSELDFALSLKKDTAPGLDNITYSMMRHLHPSLKTPLLETYNTHYVQHTIRDKALHAKIIPIPKKEPGQFRPISLLPVLDKIFEIMIHQRLLNTLPPFHKNIHGFRRNHSTTDCLSQVYNLIHDSPRLALFIDFNKAFELIDHTVILDSLSRSGISGHILHFIKNFLSNRTGAVHYQGHISSSLPLFKGVPQGSILGPLLFNVVVHHLLTTCSQQRLPFTIISYADDLVLIFRNRQSLQFYIDKFSRICSSFGFVISPTKTALMQFNMNLNKTLFINDVKIDITNSHKYLGILFSTDKRNRITFKNHFKYLHAKCTRRFSILKCLASTTWGASRNLLRTVYISLIYQLIFYGCEITGHQPQHWKGITVLHNHAIKFILGTHINARTANSNAELNLLPPSFYCNYKILNFVDHCLSLTDHPLHGTYIPTDKIDANFSHILPNKWTNFVNDIRITYNHTPSPTYHSPQTLTPWDSLNISYFYSSLPDKKVTFHARI